MFTVLDTFHTIKDNTYDVIYDSERKAYGVVVAYDDIDLEPQVRYCDSLGNAKRLAIGYTIAENEIFNL